MRWYALFECSEFQCDTALWEMKLSDCIVKWAFFSTNSKFPGNSLCLNTVTNSSSLAYFWGSGPSWAALLCQAPKEFLKYFKYTQASWNTQVWERRSIPSTAHMPWFGFHTRSALCFPPSQSTHLLYAPWLQDYGSQAPSWFSPCCPHFHPPC